MNIEDKRSTTEWVPAVDILNEVLPHFKQENFRGIRKIVLLDQDYHKGTKGIGRYCPIKGTNRADVKLYFDWYNGLPDEVKTSKLYLTYLIVKTLMHEIYHHIIRGQHRLRKPKFKAEQERADRWAEGAVAHIFKRIFPREEHEPEWNRIRQILNETKKESNQKLHFTVNVAQISGNIYAHRK